MNRLIIISLTFTLVGCNGLKRLTTGPDTPPSALQVPQAPSNLNLPIIVGYTPIKHEGWNSEILLEKNQTYISAWIYQGQGWIHPLTSSPSIQYDPSIGLLKFNGFSSAAYYLVYQYVPN